MCDSALFDGEFVELFNQALLCEVIACKMLCMIHTDGAVLVDEDGAPLLERILGHSGPRLWIALSETVDNFGERWEVKGCQEACFKAQGVVGASIGVGKQVLCPAKFITKIGGLRRCATADEGDADGAVLAELWED